MTVSATPPPFISRQVKAARRFYLNLRPRAASGITVVCGGREDCSPDFTICRPRFPYFAVEFVAAGAGELVLGNRRSPLAPGTVFSYGGAISQWIRTDPDQPLVKYFVNFVGRPGLALMRDCGLAPGSICSLGGIAEVRAAFDALIWQGLRHDRRTDAVCALQLQLLLHSIARARRRHAPTVTQRRARATFERVTERIDSDFLQLDSVEALARACHLEASHLSRLTRRFGQESPLRLLQRRKMQWAAERLENTNLLVRQVADELGLDAFQFSRTFKRVHGVSPSAFLAART